MVEPSEAHRRALDTLSRCLGQRPLDSAACLHGALVCLRLCPF